VQTWEHLEQKFHEYFYSGEAELRLSHLAAIRQKHNEGMADYVRWLREARNKCYSLLIGERDLVELAFAGLTSAMRDRMDGQDFAAVNQLRQCAMMHENRAKEGKSHGRFKEATRKGKPRINYMDEESASDEDIGVCVAEWVDNAKEKPLASSFPRLSPGKKDEMK
jgi:hypothetical protein